MHISLVNNLLLNLRIPYNSGIPWKFSNGTILRTFESLFESLLGLDPLVNVKCDDRCDIMQCNGCDIMLYFII
jgi:hypothetical protein